MQSAVVTRWGDGPVLEETDRPPIPEEDSDQTQIKVVAVGIHQLVRARASGRHYSTKTLPHIPGTDGVGELSDGRMAWFSGIDCGGTLREYVNVPKSDVFPAPSGADAAQLAAFVNPAFSSWMALSHRCTALPKGFSVLILGATSASGIIAAHFARKFGASRVVGCARNAEALSKADLSDTIVLADPVQDTDFSKANDVHVVLDYLYGAPAHHFLTTVKPTVPMQYIQIGSLAGPEIPFKSDIVRSKDLTIRGSGFGSWSNQALASKMPNILEALAQLRPGQVNSVPLKDIESTWNASSGGRLVYIL